MANQQSYDKILTRFTQILRRLYEGEVLSVSELAKEFNVSTKTIQRDFNERLYHFPIEKVGRKWKMSQGHSIVKERTIQEKQVIEVLENIANGISDTFGANTKNLFSKIQNPTDNSMYSKTIIEDITGNVELLFKIEDSIRNRYQISFYFNEKLRHVNPYKIVSFDGFWYLYAYEILSDKIKTYYFNDIRSVELSDSVFIVQENIANALKNSLNAWFEPNAKPFKILLHVKSEIAKYFYRRPLCATQVIIKEYEDGSIDIELFATSEKEILLEIKKWMPNLIVKSPKSLAKASSDVAIEFINAQIGTLSS
ncbi:MAG: WYL domain-containing protein [Campylobacterota bacterium]|nr:WYL domain-containing protein [Campylobacterota bacterium]